MNYLFFDLECANCFNGTGKICEFGYILTDEDLNVIKHGIYMINPNAEFDWYVKHKIISYKEEEYFQAPLYPKIYNSYIKDLIEMPNTICVGHGIGNDVKYLNNEAQRYNLPKVDFEYFDTAIIWKNYHNEAKTKKLKIIVNELEIGDSKKLHNSEYDSFMILEYVKIMCNESGISFKELCSKYADPQKNHTNNIVQKKRALQKNDFKLDKSPNHMMRGKRNHSLFRLYIESKATIGEKSDKLLGKKITVSMNYEAEHFKEMVILAGMISAAGGEYETRASCCDIFATFEKIDALGEHFHCNRLDHVNEAIKNGKSIEIITFEDLLRLLGTSRESLEAMPPVDVVSYIDERYKKYITSQ